jgi:hypothetical protein
MHIEPEIYQRFRSITNYEGNEVDHEMESVLMLVMMKMMIVRLIIHAKEGLVTTLVTIFPRLRPWSSMICPLLE